jgi:hypothetical protein
MSEITIRRTYEEQNDMLWNLIGEEEEPEQGRRLKVILQFSKDFARLDAFIEKYRERHSLRTVVELGVHKGGSFWMLSRHVEEGGLMVGVDNGKLGKNKGKVRQIAESIFELIRLDGIRVIPHWMTTNKAVLPTKKQVSKDGVDLLHIDAGHTYESCRSDWDSYVPMVNKGGLILLHDTHNGGTKGVVQVWHERCGKYKERYEFQVDGVGTSVAVVG